MRLFRCDTVDGTYTDAAGKDMYLFVEHKDHGLKMMGNYTFPSLTQTYMAPGGQTAFEDEDGKLVLLDYKTDRSDDAAKIKKRYQVQLGIYSEAVEAILGRSLDEKYVYLLQSNKLIAM